MVHVMVIRFKVPSLRVPSHDTCPCWFCVVFCFLFIVLRIVGVLTVRSTYFVWALLISELLTFYTGILVHSSLSALILIAGT